MICLDTNVLIWAVRETSPENPPEPDLPERARRYLGKFDKSKVLLPSVVVWEHLAFYPLEEQEAQFKRLLRFRIEPVDIAVARKAAELTANRMKIIRDARKKVAGDKPGKQCLKSDTLVVATAIVKNAEAVIAYDQWFEDIAQNQIEVRKLPPLDELREQQELDMD